MNEQLSAEDVTRRGAEVLDARVPGWAERLDLSRLDLLSLQYCVLGQLFRGDYHYGLSQVSPYDGYSDEASVWAGQRGFNARNANNNELVLAWSERVRERLAPKRELVLGPEEVALLRKRMRQILDPNHTLIETVIEIGDVNVRLTA